MVYVSLCVVFPRRERPSSERGRLDLLGMIVVATGDTPQSGLRNLPDTMFTLQFVVTVEFQVPWLLHGNPASPMLPSCDAGVIKNSFHRIPAMDLGCIETGSS